MFLIRLGIWLFCLAVSFSGTLAKEPRAVKGVMDLRGYDPEEKIKVSLNGEWEFYWNRFLYPPDFKSNDKPRPDIYGQVPAYWTSYRGEIRTEKYGFATYRLIILLPKKKGQSYAFDIPVFDSSFELWVDDTLLFSNGKPGKSEETTIPEYRTSLRRYTPRSDTISVLINVANFHHRRGGFWQAMMFGKFNEVQKTVASKWAADYLTTGILGSFAIFFLLFFLIYPRDKVLLVFSLTLLCMAIRPFFTSEYLIYDFASFSWTWTIRLEYISSFLALAGWAWYNYFLFPFKANKISASVFSAVISLVLILVTTTSVKIFSYTVFILYAVIITLVIFALTSSFIGLLKKRLIDAAYFFLFIIISFGAVHDIFVSLGKTHSSFGYAMPFLMVMFLFAQSVLLLYKWIQAFYEKERLQKELEKININLENIVNERTHEIKTRNDEIEKKNMMIEAQNLKLTETLQFKNKIFSVIAHDLRSPIVNILYILNLLKDKNYKQNFEEFTNSSINYAQMVINLLENMLLWGKGQEDKIKFSPAKYDFASIILTNISIFKEPADRKNIKISFTQKGNSIAFCDRDLLDIVIRNLLSNAVKYTHPGGRISVLLKDNPESRTVTVKVCDNGTGIPEHRLKDLFTSANVESTPGTSNEKGTGLGLKLCRELVEINNGKITVESTVGRGTSVHIVLPSAVAVQPANQ